MATEHDYATELTPTKIDRQEGRQADRQTVRQTEDKKEGEGERAVVR